MSQPSMAVGERIDVAHVVTDHRETCVAVMRSDVPLAPGREVVIDRDAVPLAGCASR